MGTEKEETEREEIDGEARALVAAIVEDFRGRAGFDHVWDTLDPSVRTEIESAWGAIAVEHMDRACFGPPDNVEDDGLPF